VTSGPTHVKAVIFRISPKTFRYTMLAWSISPDISPIYFTLVCGVHTALVYLSSVLYVASLNNV
jgi:hypothetical protein